MLRPLVLITLEAVVTVDIAPHSRRTVLAGAIGALAATVAGALGRPMPVQAHDPDDVRLGDTNNATATTVVNNSSSGQSAIWGNATAATGANVGVRGDAASQAGWAVWGNAPSGVGVYGLSNLQAGVRGSSYYGVGVT